MREYAIGKVAERTFFIGFGALAAVSALTIGAAHGIAGPRLNVTSSMPRGLYFYIPGAVKRGDIVQACLPAKLAMYAASHFGLFHGACPDTAREPIVKAVAALPGDRIVISPAGVSINGELWPDSKTLKFDSHGRRTESSLTSVAQIISPSEIFLLGRNAHSWDSRYFGAIPMSAVHGRWFPLLTEKGSTS